MGRMYMKENLAPHSTNQAVRLSRLHTYRGSHSRVYVHTGAVIRTITLWLCGSRSADRRRKVACTRRLWRRRWLWAAVRQSAPLSLPDLTQHPCRRIEVAAFGANVLYGACVRRPSLVSSSVEMAILTCILPHTLLHKSIVCETLLADESVARSSARIGCIFIAQYGISEFVKPLFARRGKRPLRRSCRAHFSTVDWA